MPIDAGSLTNYGKIQRITRARFGVSEVPTPQDLFPCWAAISTKGGREFYAAKAASPQLTHEVVIRWRADQTVRPADQFVFKGRIFDIQTVINTDETNEEWRLNCIERLAQ